MEVQNDLGETTNLLKNLRKSPENPWCNTYLFEFKNMEYLIHESNVLKRGKISARLQNLRTLRY